MVLVLGHSACVQRETDRQGRAGMEGEEAVFEVDDNSCRSKM